MPVFLLPFLGLLKSGAGALWIWLCHRSFWQLVCIGLLALSMVQFIGNRTEKRHSAKLQSQVVSLSAELKRISTAKNDQAVVTAEKIKTVTQRIHDAEGKARIIERAPLPGQCRTPPEILGADL